MTIKTLKQAEAALLPYVPLAKQFTGQNITLERIRPLMKLLGNPEDQLKIIHIAGTSGKTSTAYYMSALLQAAGKKVGLTVSPHVDKVTERIQINGLPMDDAEFCEQLGEFLEIIEQSKLQPTYFELIYAFAIWVLNRQGVDYAVVETGLGGLHDATNVAERADKVCILTDIGFDHTNVLGKTLAEIAAQKVGIVHIQNHIFMYHQADEIMNVVEPWIGHHQATLHIVKKPVNLDDQDNKMPVFQQRNWQLAYNVYKYLSNRDNLPHLTRQVLLKTQKITIPGRMEIRHLNGKTIIMDGAHNAQKMLAFISSFKKLYPDTKPAILLALKQDKDYHQVIPLLVTLASHIIVTTFETTQDLPVVSMDSDTLAQALQQSGAHNVISIRDNRAAFKSWLQTTEEEGIITGSFYLLSQIRNNESLGQ